jgi:hypothetical protein
MGNNLNEKNLDCSDIPSLDLPEDWRCIKTEGPGPFVTRAILRHPLGGRVHWNSREHRKHHNLLDDGTTSTWWAPGAIGWWVGVLFSIGAICFALGAAPGYIGLVGSTLDGLTFFVGSIFFTTAAFLQYLETVNARQKPESLVLKEKIRFLIWEPRRIDWLASVIQFIGTLFFNISTYYALNSFLSIQQMDHQVWSPDVFGSICFLIASGLLWMEVGHSLFSWNPRNISWQIAFLNLLGSVAFGFSAVSAFVQPVTGHYMDLPLMNMGTFIGGVFFLIAAILLLPERTKPDSNKNSKTDTS